MQLDLDGGSAFVAILGFLSGLGAWWLKYRKDRRQGEKETAELDRNAREEIKDLLGKMMKDQVSWMAERNALHKENLAMRTELQTLRDTCAQLKKELDALKGAVLEEHKIENVYWREHLGKAPLPVLRIAADGVILDANEAFEAKYGYALSQVQDMKMHDLTHPDDLEAGLEMVRECLSGDRDGYSMRKRYQAAAKNNGTWIPAMVHVQAVWRQSDFAYFNTFVVPE